MSERELADLRREYAAGGLDEAELPPEPLVMFRRWLHDVTVAGLHEPNAMVVATATRVGVPSARLVLLKALDERGFVFFTNYDSRKGIELAANPSCALMFPWHDLERQVRVEGRAAPLSVEENAGYFGTRPRASQLGAWASPQSQVVASRAELDRRFEDASVRFGDGDVASPPHWGGFRVAPEAVEFWQGRRGRMHDRLRYRRVPEQGRGFPRPGGDDRPPDTEPAGLWLVERLAP